MARAGVVKGSIRFRITAVATAVVALVLVVTGVVIVVVQRQQLYANLDDSLEQRADLVIAGVLADPDSEMAFANSNAEDRLAQLVDTDGTVLHATENLLDAPAVAPDPDDGQAIETYSGLPIEDDVYRVLSRRFDGPDGELVLHIGQNVDDLTDSIRVLATSLAVAVLTLVGLFALLVWWLVGRTLRPVEEIRSEVAAIGARDLSRRVPEPGSDDEIARLASTMNEMLDRVATATSRQQRFVADASHELRTPLTRIRTELEVDLAAGSESDRDAIHRSVLDEVVGMQLLIEDLLHLARTDAGEVAQRRDPVDLDDVVAREVQQLRLEVPSEIDMSAVSGAGLEGDADQLKRAVRNLLHNAARHASRRVGVSLAETDGHVVLTVDDDGPGIPADQRDRVFERFARLDRARVASAGGSGLGLAITRDIVLRHGGTIVIDDSDSGGARFTVRLPTRSRVDLPE